MIKHDHKNNLIIANSMFLKISILKTAYMHPNIFPILDNRNEILSYNIK